MNASNWSWARNARAFHRLCVVDAIQGTYSWWKPADSFARTNNSRPVITAHAASVIGAAGVARINEFWNYPRGWDSGKGHPLSPNSLWLFEEFLRLYPGFSSAPSVFLTIEGNLVLGWEDRVGSRIEAEFSPAGLELYLGSDDNEFVFDSDEDGLNALVVRLQEHEAHAA